MEGSARRNIGRTISLPVLAGLLWLAAAGRVALPLAAQVVPGVGGAGGAAGGAPGLALSNIATPLPPAPSPAAVIASPSHFQGSVPTGEATGEMLQLSLADALERGLRTNLGVIDKGLDSQLAQAERQRALSNLLPQLSGKVSHQTLELSLVTFGFKIPGIPQVIGPFSFQDARLTLTDQLFNLQSLYNFRSARESAHAAELSLADARELVVEVVGAAYYQVVASASRLDTARAQGKSSRALEELAQNQVKSGLTPSIDVFRATVQRQTDEQRVAVYEATVEKDKLTLGRLIGLPAGQRFAITTPVPYVPWSGPGQEEAIKTARASRSDLKSATAAFKAAELAKQAAEAERLPSLAVSGDYGRVGKNLVTTDGTYTLFAGISLPIYEGGRIHAEVTRAEATLERRRAELADLEGRVEYEVRSNFLDLRAAETSAEVALKNVDLAEQTLAVAQDRFANGVTNNVEVVLAEQELAAAHENYIASLFSHNFTKLSLLRAMGQIEQGVKQFLGGQAPGGAQ
ncbi:MAG TPA: TolC family protein [Thermoanaerobaculia bacterium]|nr:TolC family protein [Thermoanaerobaculia bacterium]